MYDFRMQEHKSFFFLTPGVTLTGWQGALGLTPLKLLGEQLEGKLQLFL